MGSGDAVAVGNTKADAVPTPAPPPPPAAAAAADVTVAAVGAADGLTGYLCCCWSWSCCVCFVPSRTRRCGCCCCSCGCCCCCRIGYAAKYQREKGWQVIIPLLSPSSPMHAPCPPSPPPPTHPVIAIAINTRRVHIARGTWQSVKLASALLGSMKCTLIAPFH